MGRRLAAVELNPGIANVIANFPETLQADATFTNTAARDAWVQMSDRPYDDISDVKALLLRRAQTYQSDPAFI